MIYYLISIGLLLIVIYSFCGYKIFLQIWSRLAIFFEKSKECLHKRAYKEHSVTVLLTVHNEEKKIASRLENLLNQDYPSGLLEILVVSDHSDDGTDDVVREFCESNSNISLYAARNAIGGKTAAQNEAIPRVVSDLLLFTDANITFESDFISAIVKPFESRDVGAVDGRLIFEKSDGAISESQGYYWNYELDLRELESALGFLAVSSGATLTIRRDLFREMINWVGEDCVVPLDIIEQGYRIVHNKNALAYESMPKDFSSERKARVRMTLRNWQGTWAYADLLNPFKSFRYAFSLWSHKLLRWLTPYFLLGSFFSSLLGALVSDSANIAVLFIHIIMFLLAMLGSFSFIARVFPLAGHAYSFLAANIGFALGVLRAVSGAKIHRF